ncbi:hypothetical protein KRIGEM_03060 (plasmid) [Komagataeibacter rhaeticus]|nr:hypothetical protein KRIGEM_03060 [Komagataeibacter rhaeticus]
MQCNPLSLQLRAEIGKCRLDFPGHSHRIGTVLFPYINHNACLSLDTGRAEGGNRGFSYSGNTAQCDSTIIRADNHSAGQTFWRQGLTVRLKNDSLVRGINKAGPLYASCFLGSRKDVIKSDMMQDELVWMYLYLE